MKQNTKKHSLLLALPVLAALVFGTIGTSNAFADVDIGFVPDNVSLEKSDAFLNVSTESPVDKDIVQFRGGTDGWAIIGGQAYDSKIGMTGKAVHQGNGVWKVKSLADITVENRHATLELKGKAVDGKLRLHGTGTLDGGEPFRIILRGNYAPIYDQPGDFVLDWSMAKIQNMENGLRIPLAQDGVIHVKPLMSVEELDDLESELNIEE
ncbi:hypothetical protein [Nitrosopumilus ureiphilus]|uniref:Uncharacterized protein n=1 Tax=Nitrosopumilus ureiphilus TaxID=1470067 RepID=A0A7D5R7N4_9ARCH|nr:hypothetical protein [Nitrosopumilus ureiphilus]QLH06899.1 hypothetical protein C5F50_07290 [Nitrosopumilus ureiphilus]